MIRILSTDDPSAAAVLDWRVTQDPALARRVRAIVNAVRLNGDSALERFARRYDGFGGPFEIPKDEWRRAARSVPAPTRRAIAACARNIRAVARTQRVRPSRLTVAPGVVIEQRVEPFGRVGCYVPGGRYPLPSSLLMTAIPARVAGVRDIVVVCPQPDAVVLAAALEAGATRVFRLGGAQAVAALAYGTETIPRVDKIVGPGNRFVAAAKSLVSRDCGIDFEAGPTELVWLTDTARPDWVALDLIAQAEHDPDARALVVTTSRKLAQAIAEAVSTSVPATGPAAAALRRNGAILVARTKAEARSLVDRIAPEHLATDDAEAIARTPRAGTVFVGGFAAPAAGDYATGSNHVLPTAGAARVRGGLSAADFVRCVAVQRITRAGLARIASAATTLARVEGLTSHAASIDARLGTAVRSPGPSGPGTPGLKPRGYVLGAPGRGLDRSEYEHACLAEASKRRRADGGSLRNAPQERVRATEGRFAGPPSPRASARQAMSSPSEGRGHGPGRRRGLQRDPVTDSRVS
jgi:histidinol dehydrogenase